MDAASDTGTEGAPEPTPEPAQGDASTAPDAAWSFDGGEEIPHAETPTDAGGTGCSLHASTTKTTPLWTVAIALGVVFRRRRRSA
jgi:MYXO-CTERM domain-containing protein